MDLVKKLNKNELKELFSKNWMTHDAMWYGSCVQTLGAETANQLNQAAARLMAGVEIRRVLNLMALPTDDPIRDFSQLADIISTTFELVKTGFMGFDYDFPGENVLRGRFHDCFAHKGVKKYGLIDGYECGIVERVKGWLDGLGVTFAMVPEFRGCLMHQTGSCEIEFHFHLS